MPEFRIETGMLEGHIVKERPALAVHLDEWRAIQKLSRDALDVALGTTRSPQEIDGLVHMGDLNRYMLTRRDPNKAVELGEFFPNQILEGPRVITVNNAKGDLVGYMYVVDKNISGGSKRVREIKDRWPYRAWWVPKVGNAVYFKLQEVMVDPDAQNKGIAKTMGRTALEHAEHERQKVATYVYKEYAVAMSAAKRLGFKEDPPGNETDKAGPLPRSEPFKQVRLTQPVKYL